MYLAREETDESFDWRMAETGFTFVGHEPSYLKRTVPYLLVYAVLGLELRMMKD